MNWVVSRVIVVFLAVATPAMAERLELPSDGLESRIDFWKKIFTHYGADDIVIHDRFHVNLIYDVANESDVSSKMQAVEQALDDIRGNLDAPDQLSPIARQIREAMIANEVPLTRTQLAQLRDNIHRQRGIKERFRQGIIRSGRYLDAFREVFEKEGLPVDIALLPLVESSFENRSLSKAGAAGIWQFTRGTGRLYMKVNRSVDERLDPAKATRAAARLLRDNYRALGSWPVAITAYNHGRAGMIRAQREAGPEIKSIINNYKGPLFGYASMNFYAEFLAAVDVYNNYEQYFGQLALDAPAMKSIAAPTAVVKAAPRTTPQATAADKYRVRKGDTLSVIARRFGMSLSELMDLNGLRNSAIMAGQILLVR